MTPYLQVFTEAAHTATVIPLSSEAALTAMKLFGGYNLPLAVVLAMAGGTLGQVFNWYLGQLLRKYPMGNTAYDQRPGYLKSQRIFHKYALFLLLLCWAPMLDFLVVAAGFLNERLKTVLPIIMIGTLFYYGYHLL